MNLYRAGLIITPAGVVLLAMIFGLFYGGVPTIVDNLITKETRLIEGTETWDKWKDIPLPIYLKFYFLHIKNPNAIEDKVPFELEERGPYVYAQERHKEILLINEEEDSVTYRDFIWYRFVREMSVGDDTDVVSIMNVPFVSFATLLRKHIGAGPANLMVKQLISLGEKMVMENKSVKNLIFDGVPTIDLYSQIIALGQAVGLFPDGPPREFSNGSFGFYKGQNGTGEYMYKVSRGVKDPQTFGEVLQFQGKSELDWYTNTSLPIWADQYCNQLNGSDGTIFPPFFTKEKKMWIFLIDLCRSLYLTFDSEIDFRGIDAYRYIVPASVFENPYTNEENMCFCVNPGDMLFNSCDFSGVMRIFPCKSEAPIVISKPHFLDASELFSSMINGLNASREDHDTSADVEPRSGQLLRAIKRLMFSLQVDPLNGIPAFDEVPRPALIVPLVWVEEFAELNEELYQDLRSKLIRPLETIQIVQWTIVGVLACVVVAGLGLIHFGRKRLNKN